MTKTIASVHFYPVEAKRPMYGGQYKIPAVPKGGEPVLLTITDKYQREQQPQFLGGGLRQDRITGEQIAADLIKHWTQGGVFFSTAMTPQQHPGIWVVRDSVPIITDQGLPVLDEMGAPASRPATEEEQKKMWAEDLAHALAADQAWRNALIGQADVMYETESKNRMWFQAPVFAAAEYDGRQREWQHILRDAGVKACASCTKQIPAQAIICPECSAVVDLDRWAANEAKKQNALAAAQQAKPVAAPLKPIPGKPENVHA